MSTRETSETTITFFVDGKEVQVDNDVRVVVRYPDDAFVRTVQFQLTGEGFIGDAFDRNTENYTEAFTYDEWVDRVVDEEYDPEPPNPQNNTYSGDSVRDLQDMRDTGRPGL